MLFLRIIKKKPLNSIQFCLWIIVLRLFPNNLNNKKNLSLSIKNIAGWLA